VARQILRDLEADSLVCPGDEGDVFALHAPEVRRRERRLLAFLGTIIPPRMP
jgi:hypothetical protein